jgi:hypothetical protein
MVLHAPPFRSCVCRYHLPRNEAPISRTRSITSLDSTAHMRTILAPNPVECSAVTAQHHPCFQPRPAPRAIPFPCAWLMLTPLPPPRICALPSSSKFAPLLGEVRTDMATNPTGGDASGWGDQLLRGATWADEAGAPRACRPRSVLTTSNAEGAGHDRVAMDYDPSTHPHRPHSIPVVVVVAMAAHGIVRSEDARLHQPYTWLLYLSVSPPAM